MHLHSGTIPAGRGPALLIHGGAWDIPDEALDEHRDGLGRALDRGRTLLAAGTPAVDVVTEVVAVLEAHGAFDAGRGAVLNQVGEVELDAGLMCGRTLAYGAVAAVRRLAHPVRVARRLMDDGEGAVRLLAAAAAEDYASAAGFDRIDNDVLVSERERARYEALRREAAYHPSHAFRRAPGPQGTVGCVARDAAGHLAAATSTGGTPFKPPGRIGDSPLPGAGYYADAHGASSATGWGEAITAVLGTVRAVDHLAAGGDAEAAVRAVLGRMHGAVRDREGEGGCGGLLLLSAEGPGAWAYTTPRMARAAWYDGGEAWLDV